MGRENGATGYGDDFEAREGEHAGDVAGTDSKYRSVGTAVFCPGAHLAFEHNHHEIGRIAFTHDDFARAGAVFFALGNEPTKLFARLVLEHRYLEEFGEELLRRG